MSTTLCEIFERRTYPRVILSGAPAWREIERSRAHHLRNCFIKTSPRSHKRDLSTPSTCVDFGQDDTKRCAAVERKIFAIHLRRTYPRVILSGAPAGREIERSRFHHLRPHPFITGGANICSSPVAQKKPQAIACGDKFRRYIFACGAFCGAFCGARAPRCAGRGILPFCGQCAALLIQA